MISNLSPFKLFLYICIFRILNALLIQTQFDPDEYWQTLEPAYCQAFGSPDNHENAHDSCQGLTWEWKRRAVRDQASSKDINGTSAMSTVVVWMDECMQGPVRSYASVLPTYLFYVALRSLDLDTTWMVAKGPLVLHAVLVAAPTDFAIWTMASWTISRPGNHSNSMVTWWCLFCSLASWFNAYTLVRTYTNSVETALLAIGMMLVSPELLGQPTDASFAEIRSCLSFTLGGISTAIRFTSLAAYVPMGVTLALQRSSFLGTVRFLLFNCAICGILGISLTMVIDRALYGFWCIPFLGNFHFNVMLGNGSLYGTHPFHWYFSAGIPAMTGLLLPFLVMEFWRTWFLKNNPSSRTSHRSRRNLWIIAICYSVAHSFSGHKEFRFLLPMLPVFCVLAGESVGELLTYPSQKKQKDQDRLLNWRRINLFVSINLVPVIYLGIVHQRAPIDVNKRIVEVLPQRIHKGTNSPPETYSVHYLMGCHSTPLLSHMHVPVVNFDTWHLDCSPKCRSDPHEICESDLFEQDPGMFMEHKYFECENFEVGVCVTDFRIMYPDFLVTYAGHVPSMKSRIAAMGLSEVGRFIHGINGLRVKLPGSQVVMEVGSDAFQSTAYSSISILFGLMELSLDEMVLFAGKDL